MKLDKLTYMARTRVGVGGSHTHCDFLFHCDLAIKFYHLIVPLFVPLFFSAIEIIEQIELNFFHVNYTLFGLRESLLHQKLKYYQNN